MFRDIIRFIKSLFKYTKSGFSNVSGYEYHRRLLICGQCDKNQNGVCKECSCVLKLKAHMATEECPLNKWDENPSLKQNVDVVKPPCGCRQNVQTESNNANNPT